MEKSVMLQWNPYPIRCVTAAGTTVPGRSSSERVTRWYELEYVLEGNGAVIMNGVSFPAVPGSLFLRPPGLNVQSVQPYRSLLIVFDLCYDPSRQSAYDEKNFLAGDAGILPELDAESLRLRTGEPVWDWFEEFSDAYLSSAPGRWLTMKTLILRILEFLLEHKSECETKSKSLANHAGQITALQNHIRSHLAESFSLKQASTMCGLSEGFLCRTFRKINGLSLVEYVNQTKIGYAKRLLSETNLSVKAIALAAGFQTETYFYTLFRRLEGVTPTRFREMHRFP